ncbi:MAG: TPM domain-containing protein [Alphaproteobacteria bacterium]|nr:TPM domain-containing protein [Alphaproteobacteria bacterium]
MLSAIEEDRIAAAVHEAEEGTSGEVVVVLAKEVSHYPDVALAYASAVALVVPPIALAGGLDALIRGNGAQMWTAAQAGAAIGESGLGFGVFAVVQAVLFVLVFLLVEITPVRRALTPATLKRHRVDRAARQQFAALAARAQNSATGVLIFVALEDRQVRVEAEAALHEKAGDAVWTQAARAIAREMRAGHDPTRGIIEAIGLCGAALKAHFPQSGAHASSISDRPIEI